MFAALFLENLEQIVVGILVLVLQTWERIVVVVVLVLAYFLENFE
jgi:hypothetical protein